MDITILDLNAGTGRAAFSSEFEKTEGDSDLEFNFLESVLFGAAGVATSAAVGILNTGIAFGQTLGIAEDGPDSFINEGEVVDNVFGDRAGDFFQQHETALQFGGLLLGAAIPGAAAIKILRVAQTSGKLPAVFQARTGLKNGDLLLNSKQLQTAKQAAFETAETSFRNPEVLRVYKNGLQQQFMEAVAFDVAVAATNNQNSMLNPDDVGFLEGAKNVFLEGLPFTFLGGAIGGGIEVLRAGGAVRKFVRDEHIRTGKFAVPDLGSSNLKPGDKLIRIAEASVEHGKLLKEVGEGDRNTQIAFNRGKEILRKGILDAAEEAGVSNQGQLDALTGILNRAQESGDISVAASLLSSLTKISKINNTDFNKLSKSFENIRGPLTRVEGDTATELVQNFERRQEEFKRLAQEVGLDDFADSIPADRFNLVLNKPENTVLDLRGATRPQIELNLVRTEQNNGMLLPSFDSMNSQDIKAAFETNKVFASKLGFKFTDDLETFTQRSFLTELARVKNNNAKAINLITNSISAPSNERVFREFITPAIRNQGGKAEDVEEILAWFRNPDMGATPKFALEFGSPDRLLRNAGKSFIDEEFAKKAAALSPRAAKFFGAESGTKALWDDAEVFFNSRTGKISSRELPGINDLSLRSKVKFTKKDGGVLNVPELQRSFKFNPKLISQLDIANTQTVDFDAQWNIANRADIGDILPKSDSQGNINLSIEDLPVVERVATEILDGNVALRLQLDGVPVDQIQLRRAIIDEKIRLRDRLLTDENLPHVNEAKIQKILNVSEEFAMGVNSAESILTGVKNFRQPEVHKFSVEQFAPDKFVEASKTIQALRVKEDLIQDQERKVATELFGEGAESLPNIDFDETFTVNPGSRKATLIGGLRTEFGSLREKAQFIGKLTTQKISQAIKAEDEKYAKFFEIFNRPENTKQRIQLAEVTNLAKRNWYYRALDKQGNGFLVSKDAFHNLLDDLGSQAGQKIEFDPSMLERLSKQEIDALRGKQVRGDSALVELDKDVSEFIGMHVKNNKEIVGKKRRLAAVRGKDAVYDENVFYPPPKNPKSARHFAFVEPTAAMRGSDPRKFMLFGETAEELRRKVELANSKFPGLYKVVTQEDVSQIKRLQGEFDEGLVFDDIFFDAGMRRKGNASELLPNLDLQTSSTLDNFRQWSIKQQENLIKSSVELRYQPIVDTLKRMDTQADKLGRTNLDKRFKKPDSIFQDTVNIMTGNRGIGSRTEQEFVRINDFIGDVGSQVIDGALSALKPLRNAPLTEQNMAEFNKQLADQGIKSPMLTLTEAMVASPKVKNDRTLRELTRTLSNVVTLGMLRMDWAHSMLQLISTPILGLPVLNELKQSLRGTARGKQLEDMTNVINPASGQLEPTPMKLFMEGTKKFFEPEGKEFLQQLRDRNIVSDYLIQYLDTLDFSALNGNHTLRAISDKTDQIAQRLSRVSLFTQSEEFTRFQIAWAAKRFAEIGGKSADEMWPIVSSSVDKVHGVFIGTQRPQLFQGVLGQAMGLYQTYFFNFMQNMGKFIADGEVKNLAILAGMQTSIFGVQSWTGFDAFNRLIADTNRDQLDLFKITGADDPKSNAAYLMYGLGSHSLGVPIDFFSRGDLAVRQSTVLPTNPFDFPVVSTIAKVSRNIGETAGQIFDTDDGVGVKDALINGLAHNGFNRPLQGVGNIIRNKVTSNNGQLQWDNIAFTGDSIWDAEEIHWSSMFARILGARPLDEAIATDAFFRDAAFDKAQRSKMQEIGKRIKLNVNSGNLETQDFSNFARQAEKEGVDIQSFNAFWTRQLQNASEPTIQKFSEELERERSYERMLRERSIQKPWEQPSNGIPQASISPNQPTPDVVNNPATQTQQFSQAPNVQRNAQGNLG